METVLERKHGSVLSNVNYLLLFLGGFVSRVGNGVHSVGLVWYIMQLKGSGLTMASVLMLASLPGVLLGPFSGVLVDRWNRKQIIIWMDVARGLIAVVMGFLIINGAMTYTYLMLGTVLIGICGTLFNPAVSASIPNIVKDEHLTQANSLEHMSMNVTGIIGPALGGVLIGFLGVSGIFIANGISYLLSAFSEVFIQLPPQKKVDGTRSVHFLQEMKDSGRYIYQQKPLFYTLFTCLFANFLYGGCFAVGLPLVLNNILHTSAVEYGIIQAAWPIGAALGGLLLVFLPEVKKIFKLFVMAVSLQTLFFTGVGIVAFPAVIGLIGLSTAKLSVIGLLIIAGIFNAMVNIPIFVIVQRMIPDEIRGKIFAMIGTMSQGLVPVSMGLAGLVADLILPNFLFIFVGIGMVFVVLYFIQKKEVRSL